MSKTFKVGDRVEFTPTQEDGSYPGDLEQYRGQRGVVTSTAFQHDTEMMGLLLTGESGLALVDVLWDDEATRDAIQHYPGDGDDRTSFTNNLTKIEED